MKNQPPTEKLSIRFSDGPKPDKEVGPWELPGDPALVTMEHVADMGDALALATLEGYQKCEFFHPDTGKVVKQLGIEIMVAQLNLPPDPTLN